MRCCLSAGERFICFNLSGGCGASKRGHGVERVASQRPIDLVAQSVVTPSVLSFTARNGDCVRIPPLGRTVAPRGSCPRHRAVDSCQVFRMVKGRRLLRCIAARQGRWFGSVSCQAWGSSATSSFLSRIWVRCFTSSFRSWNGSSGLGAKGMTTTAFAGLRVPQILPRCGRSRRRVSFFATGVSPLQSNRATPPRRTRLDSVSNAR